MLIKIAWRNIWSDRLRSSITIAVVALGVATYVVSSAMINGYVEQLGEETAASAGHLRVVARGSDAALLATPIRRPDEVRRSIEQTDGASASAVVESVGMATRAGRSTGIAIFGVDPGNAGPAALTASVSAGVSLSEAGADEIIVSRELTDRLRLAVGDVLVLMLTDAAGELASAGYRVGGILRSDPVWLGRPAVFGRLGEVQRLTRLRGAASFITVSLADASRVEAAKQEMSRRLDSDHVVAVPWRDHAPQLDAGLRLSRAAALSLTLLTSALIALTLTASIQVALRARGPQLGMMASEGVTRRFLYGLAVVEAAFVLLIGLAVGVVVAGVAVAYFGEDGVSLAGVLAEGSAVSIGRVYPATGFSLPTAGFTAIILVSFAAIQYPAVRAGLSTEVA